jgi:peptidoglycan/xylan/chitin deacetylase (PgdA/CDA1 family)
MLRMHALLRPFKASGKRALREPALASAAVRAAAWRGHDLVLVYHRIRADDEQRRDEVAVSVARGQLRAQLEALAHVGDIVDLRRLLESPPARRRPRFAITFDDDYVHHQAHALPVLQQLGVPATFFVSGRALHGLGVYWWERLEMLVDVEGIVAAGRAVGVAAQTLRDLASRCESDPAARQRVLQVAPEPAEPPLDADGILSLVAAGMTLGFHTLEHELLPALDDRALSEAVTRGRAELAALTGSSLDLFAYPHGKADTRVAYAVRSAGFRAAWTGWPQPHTWRDDPFLLGRWEPGPLDVDAFVGAVALRLHRASPRDAS